MEVRKKIAALFLTNEKYINSATPEGGIEWEKTENEQDCPAPHGEAREGRTSGNE